MHVHKTTQKIGSFKQGDRIEAKVNDKNHALSIALPEELMPVTGRKRAAIRSTKLMPITGDDACRMNDSTLESGKPARGCRVIDWPVLGADPIRT
ncbi:MAG: hypothetical protein ABI604_20195 [Nitrospirota bacterium]